MLVRGAGQEVEHTASRRSGPRRWLRAVAWLIAEGMHPRAGATTLRLAEDLAARMDYTTGHVRYCLAETAARLRVAQATVKRHAAVLRELGALAWAVRGTKANVRRLLGLPGYAATATVYAAVIPPVYDQAHGHQVLGSGYEARVIIHYAPARPVDNSPADDTHEPPSLTLVQEEGKLKVESGKPTSTAQARSTRSRRPKKTLTVTGYKITSERIDLARRLAVTVRPLVNWVQGAKHDHLSWVFLDMVARGWGEARIVLWLRKLGQDLELHRGRRPLWPHRLIAAALLSQDRAAKAERELHGEDYDHDTRTAVPPNEAFQQAVSGPVQAQQGEAYPDLGEVPEDAWDRFALREAASQDPALILAFMKLAGREETLRVYGAAAATVLDLHAAGFGHLAAV